KLLKFSEKVTCLFFDQVNNYSNFRCRHQATWPPSTDLSTVIVDKLGSGCRTRAYVKDLVVTRPLEYYGRPGFWCSASAASRDRGNLGVAAHLLKARRFCR